MVTGSGARRITVPAESSLRYDRVMPSSQRPSAAKRASTPPPATPRSTAPARARAREPGSCSGSGSGSNDAVASVPRRLGSKPGTRFAVARARAAARALTDHALCSDSSPASRAAGVDRARAVDWPGPLRSSLARVRRHVRLVLAIVRDAGRWILHLRCRSAARRTRNRVQRGDDGGHGRVLPGRR